MNKKQLKKLKKELVIVLEYIEEIYITVENLIDSTDESALAQKYTMDYNFLNEELKIRNELLIKKLITIYWQKRGL